MCLSEGVSLFVFILCSLTCVYLYQRNRVNDRWIAILFGYIGTIQLLEYFMWKDQECSGLNQQSSRIAFYIVMLQPIVSLLVAYHFTKGKIPIWLYMINIIYVIFIIYVIPISYSKLEDYPCTKPCDGSQIGLNWAPVVSAVPAPTLLWIIFFIALISPLLLMKKNGRLFFIINLIIWLLSGIIGSYRCQGIVNIPSGSLWCMMAFMGPFIAVFINK
jgi:hypothetical protein